MRESYAKLPSSEGVKSHTARAWQVQLRIQHYEAHSSVIVLGSRWIAYAVVQRAGKCERKDLLIYLNFDLPFGMYKECISAQAGSAGLCVPQIEYQSPYVFFDAASTSDL